MSESDRETKAAAEAQGKPWFKFTFCGEIKNGRSRGERIEMCGPISQEEAQEVFKLLLNKSKTRRKA